MTNQTAAPQDGATRPYNPHDHLIKIKTKQGLKDYYPAAWRLYELNLRYEEANFSTEIVFMDIERNFVIVKCQLYLGPDCGPSNILSLFCHIKKFCLFASRQSRSQRKVSRGFFVLPHNLSCL